MSKSPSEPRKIQNRKAAFHFDLLESFEAGIALTGSEVKSVRAGKVSLDEAFAVIRDGQAYVREMNISHYENAGYAQHTAKRERKLLLHRREIQRLNAKVTERGLTLVPTQMYFNDRGLIKMRVSLARGKKLYDKRESIKERDTKRELERRSARRR